LKAGAPPASERRKRRRELAVALVGTLVIIGIFIIEYNIAISTQDIPFGRHLLLFALTGLNILLLILVIFFIIRNLFKLLFERRRRILGSRLKTRLTLAFVALTLLPTIILFIASAGAVHTSIETWFSAQVDESMRYSLIVAQAFRNNVVREAQRTSAELSSTLSSSGSLRNFNKQELEKLLRSYRLEDDLASLQVHFADKPLPVISTKNKLEQIPLPDARPSFLRIGYQGKSGSKILRLNNGAELVRSVAPLQGEISGDTASALVVDYYVPRSIARRLGPITEAYQDYQETKRMKGPVKSTYILILLVIALLVVFFGVWFGMSMARDITEPIERLAEGTKRVASGDLEFSMAPLADDELGVLVGAFNKMTQDLRHGRDALIAANMDLESRRRRMEIILANIGAGVISLDPENKITTINPAASRLLRISQSDAMGKSLEEAVERESSIELSNVIKDLHEQGQESMTRQISVYFSDMALSLVVFAANLVDDWGGSMGALLVLEDMSHIIKAQRMAAWREVARRIAHEIKNPLTPIQLNAQRLRRRYLDKLGDDSDILDDCTTMIVDQVEQLKKMVNEFYKFAKLPSANPVPSDLNGLIREVAKLYENGAESVEVYTRLDLSIPIFDLDPEQIKRALVNLVDNAIAALGKNGKIQISARYDPDLQIAIIEVADNGRGIPPQDRERIFEPYFTRKKSGAGLGLTIVSAIVADHNGFIRVKGNNWGGATFVMELPATSGLSLSDAR
jgi:two-component system nitrogen regulation sensor histidine kinase NtrY